jgi:hypothetical protein
MCRGRSQHFFSICDCRSRCFILLVPLRPSPCFGQPRQKCLQGACFPFLFREQLCFLFVPSCSPAWCSKTSFSRRLRVICLRPQRFTGGFCCSLRISAPLQTRALGFSTRSWSSFGAVAGDLGHAPSASPFHCSRAGLIFSLPHCTSCFCYRPFSVPVCEACFDSWSSSLAAAGLVYQFKFSTCSVSFPSASSGLYSQQAPARSVFSSDFLVPAANVVGHCDLRRFRFSWWGRCRGSWLCSWSR